MVKDFGLFAGKFDVDRLVFFRVVHAGKADEVILWESSDFRKKSVRNTHVNGWEDIKFVLFVYGKLG